MKAETETVLATICAADETIKKADWLAALSLLRGDKTAVADDCDKPLTREEAARKLRVSVATVTAWGKSGIIRRIAISGRRKALGYSLRSVLEILNGKAGKIGGAAGV